MAQTLRSNAIICKLSRYEQLKLMQNRFLKASIVIPTYNGAETLNGCLQQVFAQETPWDFDVHVVDSGSTDDTLAILERFPVKLTQIPNSAFSHGGTRNQAAQRVPGEYIVFLVQDAEPIGTDWLRTLVDAAVYYDATGVFGKQEPRPDASVYTEWIMQRVLPEASAAVLKRLEEGCLWEQMLPQERYNLAFFHNANSCIRREALLNYPFRHMPYGEDMDWAKRVLLAGYTIVFEPEARVLHSHDRSLVYEFKRAYSDHSLVQELFDLNMIGSLPGLLHAMVWQIVHASRWVMSRPVPITQRIKDLVKTLSLAQAQTLGAYLGPRSLQLLRRYPYVMSQVDKSLRRGV
jgi:glycosyltransferase involved in cell wall biosynthesis